LKKRYLAVAIIIAVVLLLPKYVATQVTSSITHLVASVNKLPIYSAQVVEIDEGWFSSSAIIKVGIDFDKISERQIENMPTGQGQFLVDFKSAHGPLIINDGFAIALVKWHASYSGNELKQVMQWDQSQAFYHITGTHQLWNTTDYKDKVQAFTIDNEAQNVQADFSGYEGKGTFSSSHFDYSTVISKTILANSENTALITDVEFEMSVDGSYLKAMGGALFDTEMVFKMGQLQLNDELAQVEVMNLQQVNVETVVKINKENETANIDQLVELSSASFGGYKIENLNMDVAVNRFSKVFIEKYQNIINQMSTQDPLVIQQEMAAFMQDNMLLLLEQDPEFDIKNISATLPEGKFDVNAKAQTVGITNLPTDLRDQEFWLSHLLAEANLNSDKAVAQMLASQYMLSQLAANPQAAEMSVEQINQIAAQQAPAMLDALIQQGFIVEENGVYKAAATFKDKKMLLNGKEIPLPF